MTGDLDGPPEDPLREQYGRLTHEVGYLLRLAQMNGWREGVDNSATACETAAKASREEMTQLDPASSPYAQAYAVAQAMEQLASGMRLRVHEVPDPVRPEFGET